MSLSPDLDFINNLIETLDNGDPRSGVMLLEPREDFDAALVGVVDRCGSPTVACYDANTVIGVYVERDGMTHEAAVEFFYFNTLGAFMGEGSPYYLFSGPGP